MGIYSTTNDVNITEETRSDFLQLQVGSAVRPKNTTTVQYFYTFDPSVSAAWYGGVAYAPTAFLLVSPYPFDDQNDTSVLDGELWRAATPISAGNINYVSLHQTQTINITGGRTSGPYEISITAVAPAAPLTLCASTGCVFNLAISYGDTLSTTFTETHQYGSKQIALAAVAYWGTASAVAGVFVALQQYWVDRKWTKALGLGKGHKFRMQF